MNKIKKKKMNQIKGISMISLVITIIVIIILATIMIVTSLNSVDMAGFGKFTSEFADFRLGAQSEALEIKGEYGVKNIQKNNRDIYYEMATGIKNAKAVPTGYIEYLNIEVFPEYLAGNEYYEITNEKLLKELYPNKPNEQKFYVTDEGDCFMLPGYLYEESAEIRHMYINEKNYYINDNLKSIIVTFDTDGGNVIPANKIVKNTKSYNSLPVPTKEGYVFKGWYTSKDGGELITSESVVNITEDHTLYAQWSMDECIVEFNVNGGNSTFSSKTVKYNEEYGELPTPIRTDYIFKGWYTSLTGGELIAANSIVKTIGKHTLYAHWISNEQTVKFDANGGTVTPVSKVVKYNETYGSLPTPTMLGYIFSGWYTEKSGGEEITSSSIVKIESEQTLYATWAPKGYTIMFDANEGKVIQTSKTVEYTGVYGELPDATRKGYDFKGWFTEKSSGTQITAESVLNDPENKTLYAQWTAKEYIINLNGNGGTVTPSSIKAKYDSKYENLSTATATRTGYDFKGWFTEKTNGTQITTNSIVNVAENQTLYAYWEPKEYTVTLNGNGGTATPSSIKVKYDSKYENLSAASATRTGYDFKGWFTEKTNGTQITDDSSVKITENQTLYAQWTAKEYIITLDGNGGTVAPSSIKVKYDGKYENLSTATATRAGYNFKGWFTEKTNGTQVTANSIIKITENQIIYAQWEAREYAINFDANGGSGLTTGKRVKYDEQYGELPEPTRIGYTFGGWYTEKTGGTLIESSTKVTVTSDTTLYAHWTKNKYTIKFDSNKPNTSAPLTGSMTSQVCIYDETIALTANSFNLEGYYFEGWTKNKDGTGTLYLDKENVKNLSSVDGDEITLYAKWSKDTYTLTRGVDIRNTMANSSYANHVPDEAEANDTTILSVTFGYLDGETHNYANKVVGIEGINIGNNNHKPIYCYRVPNGSNFDIYILSYAHIQTNSNMSDTFSHLTKLSNVIYGNFAMNNVTNVRGMFSTCGLKNITFDEIKEINSPNLTNMSGMFYQSVATSIDISKLDMVGVQQTTNLFLSCYNVTSITLPDKISYIEGGMADRMFARCLKLETIDVSCMDTTNVVNMEKMFYTDNVLKTILVGPKFNTANVENSYYMFYDSPKLVGGNGTIYDISCVDKTYARIDGKDYNGDGVADKGYFTEK